VLFLAAKKFSRFFFIAFFIPCYETPKNAIKKIEQKQPREKKNPEEQKATFFCDEAQMDFF
jgi:hypothetical protein